MTSTGAVRSAMRVMSVVGLSWALLGCGDADVTSLGQSEASALELGAVRLQLAAAPLDAACLQVTFTGGEREERRALDLTPSEATEVTLRGLPVGLVSIAAAAFAQPCAALPSAAEPSWVTAAPSVVRLVAGEASPVALELQHNGLAALAIDWEAPAWLSEAAGPVTLAVLGDTPYGAAQVLDFPDLITKLNADGGVSRALHLGDIKNGSSRCDDSYFSYIFEQVSALDIPLVYTPGDNEWTDCHRATNGAYDPLERLMALRQVFFATPGATLGAFAEVLSQSEFAGYETFVENQLWFQARVAFATVHVVGSNNSSSPWYADDTTGTHTDDPVARDAERAARILAALAWIDRVFDLAAREDAAAVVIAGQADTFQAPPQSGFVEIVQRIAARSRSFGKPVLWLQGDSHRFLVDQPLAAGHAGYGVTEPVPNLTRLVVEGETTHEYLRLHIDSTQPAPFTWERVPF